MVLDEKSLQEYPVNAGVPKGFIPDPNFSLTYVNDFPDDPTLYSNCEQAFDL